jgi:transcriptional regulator with XRE-family HTH domain
VAINCTYLSKLEKGASYPGLEIIAKLARALEIEPAELLRVPPMPKRNAPKELLCRRATSVGKATNDPVANQLIACYSKLPICWPGVRTTALVDYRDR